jgi:urease accessory protein
MLARPALSLMILAAGVTAANAHHPLGGTTPQTLWHGLLSGLGHPVIGLDHLAFTLAAGLLAASVAPLRRAVMMPLAFVAAGAAGAALHVRGVDLPGVEVAVALSVMSLGALILSRRALPAAALAALFALAGLFHGHALAESIVGAEPTPLVAYFAGLVAVQSAIALAALFAARWLAAERPALAGPAVAAAGLAAVAVGIGALVLA